MADANPSVFKAMISGRTYVASDPHVQYQAQIGRDKVAQVNAEHDADKRMELYKKWANMGPKNDSRVCNPVFMEYVSLLRDRYLEARPLTPLNNSLVWQMFNLTIGDGCYIGPNAEFLDVVPSQSFLIDVFVMIWYADVVDFYSQNRKRLPDWPFVSLLRTR